MKRMLLVSRSTGDTHDQRETECRLAAMTKACLPGSLARKVAPECPPGTGRVHIVQRGHNREPCFFAGEDYSSCLHWLGEAERTAAAQAGEWQNPAIAG